MSIEMANQMMNRDVCLPVINSNRSTPCIEPEVAVQCSSSSGTIARIDSNEEQLLNYADIEVKSKSGAPGPNTLSIDAIFVAGTTDLFQDASIYTQEEILQT